jgi:hypothetical protein
MFVLTATGWATEQRGLAATPGCYTGQSRERIRRGTFNDGGLTGIRAEEANALFGQ